MRSGLTNCAIILLSGNAAFVSPYSIYFENPIIKEPYKFVSGSLERLKEVLTWMRFVCEGLKRGRDPNGKIWISPHMTINCGNLKYIPTFEHSTEAFINLVGTLAVRESASLHRSVRRFWAACRRWVL